MAIGAGKGGIGGTGRGWSGSGNESRSAAAHAGANVGRSPGGDMGGGGGGRGRGGTSSNSRGPDSLTGIGRRQSAVDSFTSSVKGAFKGLAQGIADVTQSIGEKLGYGYDREPTFTGSQDLGKLEAHIEAQKEKGDQLAQRDQAINTVTSPIGLNTFTSPASGLLSNTLSPTAKMSYDSTEEKGLSPTTKAVTNTVVQGLLKGVPAPGVATLTNALSYAMMMSNSEENTEKNNISPQENRRHNAISAFTGSGRSGSQNLSSINNNQPNPLTWEPASYGFGDYGSHTRGLLKS